MGGEAGHEQGERVGDVDSEAALAAVLEAARPVTDLLDEVGTGRWQHGSPEGAKLSNADRVSGSCPAFTQSDMLHSALPVARTIGTPCRCLRMRHLLWRGRRAAGWSGGRRVATGCWAARCTRERCTALGACRRGRCGPTRVGRGRGDDRDARGGGDGVARGRCPRGAGGRGCGRGCCRAGRRGGRAGCSSAGTRRQPRCSCLRCPAGARRKPSIFPHAALVSTAPKQLHMALLMFWQLKSKPLVAKALSNQLSSCLCSLWGSVLLTLI